MARSLPYALGDVVAVPLRDHGFALGVVARADGKGIALGYFYSRRVDAVDDLTGSFELVAGDAAARIRFGDRGLMKGQWLVVGRVTDWDPRSWPVPEFCRDGQIVVRYDDQSLASSGVTRSASGGCRDLPEDGLAGSGFVEIRLTRLVAEREQRDESR
jgi:hypothetical protein